MLLGPEQFAPYFLDHQQFELFAAIYVQLLGRPHCDRDHVSDECDDEGVGGLTICADCQLPPPPVNKTAATALPHMGGSPSYLPACLFVSIQIYNGEVYLSIFIYGNSDLQLS